MKSRSESNRLKSLNQRRKRLMVVMAHPDDAELLSFGTIMYFSNLNYEISVVTVSNGTRGRAVESQVQQLERIESGSRFSFGLSSSSKVLQGYRHKESRAAFAENGAQLYFLGLDDGMIASDIDLISSIEEILLNDGPDIVITHFGMPCPVEHQDHTAVGYATLNAASRVSSVKTVLQAQPLMSGLMPFVPNYFVDITQHFEEKMTAIGKHQSQSSHHPYMTEEFQRGRAQANAFAAGRQHFADRALYEAFYASLILVS